MVLIQSTEGLDGGEAGALHLHHRHVAGAAEDMLEEGDLHTPWVVVKATELGGLH